MTVFSEAWLTFCTYPGYMITAQLIEEFATQLIGLDATFIDCLNAPLPDWQSTVTQLCHPHPPRAELLDLYSKANGETGSFSVGLLFGMRFLPLDEAGHNRAQWAEERNSGLWDEADEVVLPQAHQFPLFSDFNGNAAALDLTSGQMLMVGADYDQPELLTTTLEELLQWANWQIHQVNELEIEPLQGYRTAITLKGGIIVPAAVKRWRQR